MDSVPWAKARLTTRLLILIPSSLILTRAIKRTITYHPTNPKNDCGSISFKNCRYPGDDEARRVIHLYRRRFIPAVTLTKMEGYKEESTGGVGLLVGLPDVCVRWTYIMKRLLVRANWYIFIPGIGQAFKKEAGHSLLGCPIVCVCWMNYIDDPHGEFCPTFQQVIYKYWLPQRTEVI